MAGVGLTESFGEKRGQIRLQVRKARWLQAVEEPSAASGKGAELEVRHVGIFAFLFNVLLVTFH